MDLLGIILLNIYITVTFSNILYLKQLLASENCDDLRTRQTIVVVVSF